jgi:choice-of-anchor A domain-containing protein
MLQGSPNDTTASFRSAAIQRGRLRSEQLLWNVCDSLDVTLSQFQLFGSLLAPNSSLTISNAEQVRTQASHFGPHARTHARTHET